MSHSRAHHRCGAPYTAWLTPPQTLKESDMKKMNRTVLLAAAAGLLAMASLSCRTPDECCGASAEGSEHPTEHPTEHPAGDK